MRASLIVFVSLLLACSSKGTESASPATDAEGETDQDDGPPACDAAVSKGPWVVAADSTSAKVRWESCKAGGGAILLGADKKRIASNVHDAVVTTLNDVPLRMTADYPGTFFMHEVPLTDLAPGTCVPYVVEADPTASGRVCTAPPSGTAFQFATIGDTNPGFGDITQLLQKTYVDNKPQFTIHGGDIQYYSSGLESYGFWMQKMQPMLRSGSFFPAIGNHESEKDKEREEYVDRFFGSPAKEGTLDTYVFEWAGVWFFAFNTELPLDDKSTQGLFLQTKLDEVSKKPGYRFSVIWTHRPFVTCGDTGQNDALRARYKDVFAKTGVKLVIGAHMHGYERFEFDDILWLTSAGGGSLPGKVDENISRTECADRKQSGSFWNASVISVDTGKLSGITYDDKGAVRDTFERVVP
ncbi:MAG: metallophosphoesterase [Polyangiales bacterium]